MAPIQNIFDLHCDTLTECYKQNLGLCNTTLHFSLDKLPLGMRLCQAMAVFMPDTLRGQEAEQYFQSVLAVFQKELETHHQLVAQVQSPKDIAAILAEKPFAAMLTVEGGSVLAGKLDNVYMLRDAGVKMMTLTWNGENEICGGAATQKGFTPFGRQVVPLMEKLGIVVDASHLSDTGFYELCEITDAPFVASHSNARAVCHHRRNLTDDMFREICRRKGLVGLNYYSGFIRENGQTNSIQDLIRHLHHFLDLGGEEVLALGSDFDGAAIPEYIQGLEKLEYLVETLKRSGIPTRVLQNILFNNAAGFFAEK